MPPQLSRFPSGPNTISPYHQQFPSHGQHSTNHPPQLAGNPSYINPNPQINPFTANGNLLGLGGGLNAGGGFGVGSDSGSIGSHAARIGFTHGANLQHQQHIQQQSHGTQGEHTPRGQAKGRIREVWKHNLHEEMAILRDLVDKYPYIAMVGIQGMWDVVAMG
jgi:CCR4-NOT transcription complex subunit 7/8